MVFMALGICSGCETKRQFSKKEAMITEKKCHTLVIKFAFNTAFTVVTCKGGGFVCFVLFLIFYIVVGFVIHWNETAMGLHVFPIPIPPSTSLSTRSLWVFPVHQVQALVSCIQPGLVICFTLDNIHVSTLFSWNIPPSPSPTESKRLFYTSVSFFLSCI